MKDDLLASLKRDRSRMQVPVLSAECFCHHVELHFWNCSESVFQKISSFIISDVLCFESVRFY